jgi:hypothetical protein
MKKTPLARVNEQFGGKEKLVDAILGVAERSDENKDAQRRRLLAASNTKLMHLHAVAQRVKELGGRAEVCKQILANWGRGKDKDLETRISAATPARLLDLYDRSAARAKAKTPRSPTKKRGRAA